MSEERFCYSKEEQNELDKAWIDAVCSDVPSCKECPLHNTFERCWTDSAYYASAKAMEVMECD